MKRAFKIVFAIVVGYLSILFYGLIFKKKLNGLENMREEHDHHDHEDDDEDRKRRHRGL